MYYIPVLTYLISLLRIKEYMDEFHLTARFEKENEIKGTDQFKWKSLCGLSKCKLTFVIRDWGIKVRKKILSCIYLNGIAFIMIYVSLIYNLH
jgi:hypothetical protein